MLTRDEVLEILRLYEQDGASVGSIARRYDKTEPTISRIITGKTWSTVTGGLNRSRAGKLAAYRRNYTLARWEQGCRNAARIAEELGISRQAVIKIVNKYGGA